MITPAKQRFAIGVDLGGTKVASAIADAEGHILSKHTFPTGGEDGAEAVMDRIKAGIRQLLEDVDASPAQLIGIGVGSPGPLDTRRGVVVFAPNLPFRNVPVTDILQQEFHVPVFLENDANAAGLGEARLGAGQGRRHVVYITVSTGIGGGIIIDGRIYRGAHDFAGEIGHMTIEPGGPVCGCGNRGCLEAVASGTAMARDGRSMMIAGRTPILAQLVEQDPEKVNAETVAQAAQQGDEGCRELVERTGYYLGLGVANVANLLDPEMVIIGGGVAKMGEPLFARVRQVLSQRALAAVANAVEVVPAALGGDAGVIGAVQVALGQDREPVAVATR